MRRENPPRARGGSGRTSMLRGLSGVLLVAAAMNFLFVYFDEEPDNLRHRYISEPQTTARYFHLNASSDLSTVAPAKGVARAAEPKATIAYAVSATSCSKESDSLLQGAAVLGHSIHLSSIENPSSGSKYSYKLIAFVHPEAQACSHIFHKLGYEVQIRVTPINVSDVQNEDYRMNIGKQSCCGEKEFIKLYSYMLLDYPVVVHLDLDSVILKPLDDLFDAMIDGPSSPARSRIPVMFDLPMPDDVEAFFTRDYNMVNLGHKHPGMQGGFLVVKPNVEYFEEYRQIILEGNFVAGAGWNGTYGGYYGAKQIQGLCSYFFDAIHPNTAVELNRCVYNQMADNPKKERRSDKKLTCLDGREECDDCRISNVSNVVSAHFTSPCGKPWECPRTSNQINGKLCSDLRRKWFSIRKDLEESNRLSGLIRSKASGGFQPDIYFGYCKAPSMFVPLKIT